MKGRVCIAGDAAHATTPWQGGGAGQAIEDALVLKVLLQRVENASELEAAFKAYDAMLRPRAQQLVASSRETGLIMTGQAEGVGNDVAKLRDALTHKWDFIHDVDLEALEKDALNVFESLKAGHGKQTGSE